MQISQDTGHRPIIFIRFNPDSYILNGNNITSCWKINKMGICVIKKTKYYEWCMRLQSLCNQIQYWLDNTTDKMINIIHLYYNS